MDRGTSVRERQGKVAERKHMARRSPMRRREEEEVGGGSSRPGFRDVALPVN